MSEREAASLVAAGEEAESSSEDEDATPAFKPGTVAGEEPETTSDEEDEGDSGGDGDDGGQGQEQDEDDQGGRGSEGAPLSLSQEARLQSAAAESESIRANAAAGDAAVRAGEGGEKDGVAAQAALTAAVAAADAAEAAQLTSAAEDAPQMSQRQRRLETSNAGMRQSYMTRLCMVPKRVATATGHASVQLSRSQNIVQECIDQVDELALGLGGLNSKLEIFLTESYLPKMTLPSPPTA